MTHGRRKVGESGFYHVVTKGDGGQLLFERNAHRFRYLELLIRSEQENNIKIFAYCLMGNHVHLLVQAETDALSLFMKTLDESYAMYYAQATERIGHVFKGRFWSEPVESDERFLLALRYIHANPEHAGICLAKDYLWSSYRAYVGNSSFVSTGLAIELLGGIEAFERFHANAGVQAIPFPDSALKRHLGDDELMRIASRLVGRSTLIELKTMKPSIRAMHLRVLAGAGMTEAQIARLTGVNRKAIRACM